MNDPKTYVLHLLDGYFVADTVLPDSKNFKTVVPKADYDELQEHIAENLMSRGLHDSRMHAAEEREKALQKKLDNSMPFDKVLALADALRKKEDRDYIEFNSKYSDPPFRMDLVNHEYSDFLKKEIEKLGVK